MNTPFLHFPSLELETDKEPDHLPAAFTSESPFLAAPQLNGQKLTSDPKTEQLVQLMDELYDEEFEDTIDDLLNEANDLIESRVEGEHYINNGYQSRHLLQEYYMPLNRQTELFFTQLIRQGEQVDNREKDLAELETFLENYTSEGKQLTDIQEHFLGGLKKLARKAVKVVKKGVSAVGKVASKFGLKFLFDKLKKIALHFLKGILAKGINLLPPSYRSMAQGLAGKILPQKTPAPAAAGTNGAAQDGMQPAEDPAEASQQEINAALASLLTADSEQEWALIERELEAPDLSSPVDQAPATDRARQEFIGQLSELEDSAATAPPVEQFVSAVLTGVKLALPIVGRQRVINWLTALIAKLIEKFVGKDNARALSKHMVETGFRILNLEATPEEPAQVGASAVAATVEDTVRQLEHFPGYVFEDRQLFERYVVEAFEQAAAANMPDILTESVYLQHPWLRESNRHRVLWKLAPRDHRPQPGFAKIKRLNEVMETQLTPYIAGEVRTFGGISLATFLRDRMGIAVNQTLPVRVHLFEALPGSNLHHMAKMTAGLPGMESYSRATPQQFHPLTSIAAGLLLGEPGLGCRSAQCLSKQRNAGGHRYYYLEVPGARPQFFVPPAGEPLARGITNLQVRLDFLANEIRLHLYLSEADAQAVATSLRKNQPETAHLLAMMALEEGLKSAFSYGQYGYLKIVHPQVIPGKRSGLALELVPPVVVHALKAAIKTWSGPPLIAYLRHQADQFVQAAEDYADGVTLQAVLISPADLIVLRQMIAGAGISLPEALFSRVPADVLFSARPGHA